jgi:hypothetical protein
MGHLETGEPSSLGDEHAHRVVRQAEANRWTAEGRRGASDDGPSIGQRIVDRLDGFADRLEAGDPETLRKVGAPLRRRLTPAECDAIARDAVRRRPALRHRIAGLLVWICVGLLVLALSFSLAHTATAP